MPRTTVSPAPPPGGPPTTPDGLFHWALAARVFDAIERIGRDDTRELVCARAGMSDRTLKERFKGPSAFSPFELKCIIDILNECGDGLQWDANYMLTGEAKIPGVSVEAMFREIRQQVRYVADRLDDHTLGIDGLASRLAIGMVNDLKSSGGTSGGSIAGILMDRHIEIIEPYSTHTRLVTNRLDYAVQVEEPDRRKPGRFLTVVAQNLLVGHKYTYILPGPQRDWDVKIDHMRHLLAEAGVTDAGLQSKLLRFRFTDGPMAAGFVLMDLDLQRLHTEQRLLHDQIVPDYRHPDHPGVLGQIIPGSSRMHGASLMDAAGIAWATKAWEMYEKSAAHES